MRRWPSNKTMKHSRLLPALIWLALNPLLAAAQTNDQVKSTLVKLIEFSDRSSLNGAEARALLSDEALKWVMPSFGKVATAPDKIVFTDPKNAVGRVQWY